MSVKYSDGPEVVLLSHTSNLMLPAKAAVFCTSTRRVEEIMEPKESDEKVLQSVLERGHGSVLEHISFSFGVSGISRVTEAQLERHRLASYSTKSGRYTKVKDEYACVIPPSIHKHSDARVRARYHDIMESAHKAYQMLVDDYKLPQEDARYLLPQATATQLIVTMNARELLHFFGLRCCSHAQWEIRSMAWKMLHTCRRILPTVFEKAGPKCIKTGYCEESVEHRCGVSPPKEVFFGG